MQQHFGPVCEFTHHVDPGIIEAFDAWVAQHVGEMRELPGIVRASTYTADDDDPGRPRGSPCTCSTAIRQQANTRSGPRSIGLERRVHCH